MRGKFIVLEGLDRTGKSTQVAKLLEMLEKDGPARVQKFPGEQQEKGRAEVRPYNANWEDD